MKSPIKLSRGNAKIYRALIWNLPNGITCPGATELCKKVCYAKDSAVLYKDVSPYRLNNFKVAKRSDFADLMIDKLNRARINKVRIHESGDFFSQAYLNKWVKVIKSCPEKRFWAYTKSHQLDFSEALTLKNLSLRYSVDVTTKKYPKQDIARAYMSEYSCKVLVCPSSEVKGHAIRCMKDCSVCLEKGVPVIFRPHGTNIKIAKMYEEKKPLII